MTNPWMRPWLLFVMMTSLGCNDWTPKQMLKPINLPADTGAIHPWIEKLLKSDVSQAREHLATRFNSDFPALMPLQLSMEEYIPRQVVFASGVGYARCLRRYTDKDTGNAVFGEIYFAEPLSDQAVASRVSYFDAALQPIVKAFFERFAGSGEQMEGSAGQFTFRHWINASAFAEGNGTLPSEWRDAKVFYWAMNGDAVLIRSNGATAWHCLETGEILQIEDSLEKSIQAYAEFRKSHDIFDSWSFREYRLRGN